MDVKTGITGSSFLQIGSFSILLITTCIFLLIQYFLKKRKLNKITEQFNILPNPLPILGHVNLFFGTTEDILNNVMKVCKENDSPLVGWIGLHLFALIDQPEDIEIVLNKSITRNGFEFVAKAIGGGIVNARGKEWKRIRKIVAPVFNQRILDTFFPIFNEKSKIFTQIVSKFDNYNDFDLYDYFEALNSAILCETIIGIDVEYSETKPNDFTIWFRKVIKLAFERLLKVYYHPDFIYFRTKLGKTYTENANKIETFILNQINKKRIEFRQQKSTNEPENNLITNKNRKKAFLDLLVAMSEKGASLSDYEMQGNVGGLIGAATDSTTSTECFALMLLGMHKNIQTKIYKEIKEILGNDKNLELEDLSKFVYLERVIKEVLRILPVAPFILRIADEDIQLRSGKIIPKGCSTTVNIFSLHRNPRYYEDPLTFNPDRFLPEENEKRHPGVYIPFATGPRNCVGPKYAMMSLKTALIHIFRDLEVNCEYKNLQDIRLQVDLIMKPLENCKVTFKKREKS